MLNQVMMDYLFKQSPGEAMAYLWIKLIHIISSTFLFGTGLGSAYYFFMANKNRDDLQHLYYVTRNIVLADFIFTTPAVIVQPLTGFALMHFTGFSISTPWLLKSLVGFQTTC